MAVNENGKLLQERKFVMYLIKRVVFSESLLSVQVMDEESLAVRGDEDNKALFDLRPISSIS